VYSLNIEGSFAVNKIGITLKSIIGVEERLYKNIKS